MFGNARCLFPSSAKLESQTPPSVCRFCELVLCLSCLVGLSLQLGSRERPLEDVLFHIHSNTEKACGTDVRKQHKEGFGPIACLFYFFIFLNVPG